MFLLVVGHIFLNREDLRHDTHRNRKARKVLRAYETNPECIVTCNTDVAADSVSEVIQNVYWTQPQQTTITPDHTLCTVETYSFKRRARDRTPVAN